MITSNECDIFCVVICFVLFVVLSVMCLLFFFDCWLCIKLPLRDNKDTLYLVPCIVGRHQLLLLCLPERLRRCPTSRTSRRGEHSHVRTPLRRPRPACQEVHVFGFIIMFFLNSRVYVYSSEESRFCFDSRSFITRCLSRVHFKCIETQT